MRINFLASKELRVSEKDNSRRSDADENACLEIFLISSSALSSIQLSLDSTNEETLYASIKCDSSNKDDSAVFTVSLSKSI